MICMILYEAKSQWVVFQLCTKIMNFDGLKSKETLFGKKRT